MHNAPVPTTTKNGVCVKCRAELPGANFQTDAAQCLTSWCNACRQASAVKWGIDEDLVEMVFELYVYEQGLKAEAVALMTARVQIGACPQSALTDLSTRIHNHNGLKHHRISTAVKTVLQNYRSDYFASIGMEPTYPARLPPDEISQ